MFHNLLVDLGIYRFGYYRGSDDTDVILEQEFTVYGRKDLTDQIDGKKYLVENHGIDASSWDLWGFLRRFHHVDGMLTTPKSLPLELHYVLLRIGRITIMATPETFLISLKRIQMLTKKVLNLFCR
jgi:hypothetical protein